LAQGSSSFADMPLQMETQSRVLSVTDIQGKWREKSSRSVWKVTGIVVEKAGVPRLQKQPVVLSDGPNGVAWGNGNLTGNMEDGWLVWRNRRGETTYCWKKLDGSKEEMLEEVMAAEPKAKIPKVKKVPSKQYFPNLEKQSPRSNVSGETEELTAADRRQATHMNAGETAEMKAAGFGVTTGPVDDKQDGIAMDEIKMLVEMAGKRLLAGDVFMSMHYINLAQQVQPLSSSFSYDEEVTNCLA